MERVKNSNSTIIMGHIVKTRQLRPEAQIFNFNTRRSKQNGAELNISWQFLLHTEYISHVAIVLH